MVKIFYGNPLRRHITTNISTEDAVWEIQFMGKTVLSGIVDPEEGGGRRSKFNVQNSKRSKAAMWLKILGFNF